MDPVTAMGCAASVIQFVQFGSKLISESREIYRSTDGALDKNLALEQIAKNLSELNAALRLDREPGDLFTHKGTTAAKRRKSKAAKFARPPRNPSAVEQQLNRICEECDSVTQQLLKELDKLKLRGGQRKWGSFRQALSNVWSQGEIQELEKKLEGIRKQIDTTLLVYLR